MEILRQQKLGWVVDQVQQQINAGKLLEKQVDTYAAPRSTQTIFSEEYIELPSRGPKKTFPVSVEFEPPEMVELIIDALERAVIDTAEMERSFLTFFGEHSPEFNALQFDDESEEGSHRLFKINDTIDRLSHCKVLKEALDALRREI
jgi:hypothetical protein